MKLKLTKKSLLNAVIGCASVFTVSAFAGVGDWIKSSGDFVTLDRSANKVEFFVVYPQLHEANCGIGLGLNRWNSHAKYYDELLSQITVSNLYATDSGSTELTASVVSREGAIFPFNFSTQYYGTIVTISANDGKTFGEIFDSLPVFSDVYVLASAVSCEQIESAQ